MTTITITQDHPYAPSGVPTASLSVRPIGFVAYSRAMKAGAGAKTDAELRRRTMRERVKLQVVAMGLDGKEYRLSDEDISRMPIPYATQLREEMSNVLFPADASEPEVLGEGNGVTSPIHIKLGTPIKGANGIEITELEFQAKTVAELEDVISLEGFYDQTEALIAIGKPVSGTLSALPSWAIDQVTLADGIFIMNKVRPSFFEPQTRS